MMKYLSSPDRPNAKGLSPVDGRPRKDMTRRAKTKVVVVTRG